MFIAHAWQMRNAHAINKIIEKTVGRGENSDVKLWLRCVRCANWMELSEWLRRRVFDRVERCSIRLRVLCFHRRSLNYRQRRKCQRNSSQNRLHLLWAMMIAAHLTHEALPLLRQQTERCRPHPILRLPRRRSFWSYNSNTHTNQKQNIRNNKRSFEIKLKQIKKKRGAHNQMIQNIKNGK